MQKLAALQRLPNCWEYHEQLGVLQPVVSRLVSNFSGSIGLDLFKWRRGILETTSDSRYLLAEVKRIFDNLGQLGDLRRELKERTAGDIRVAYLPGFATSHLMGVLVRFLLSLRNVEDLFHERGVDVS